MSMTTISEAQRTADLKKTAEILKGADNILILTHKSPDGDTVGSAFALCRALIAMNKKAKVVCSDELPEKFGYLYEGMDTCEFEPEFIVASDIASTDLMGSVLAPFADKVGLCIDHHPSNGDYAAFTMLDPASAATCEITADLIPLLNVEIDKKIAECLYTGLATDTGCFRYSNTSSRTLRTAALMIDKGAESAAINKKLFETLSRARMDFERMALESIEYHFGGKAALITITKEMEEKTGVSDSDTDGIPALPAKIEGVQAGITLKEKKDGGYKISLRTGSTLNASQICAKLGGGGHAAAAGCRIEGTLEEAKKTILEAVGQEIAKVYGGSEK